MNSCQMILLRIYALFFGWFPPVSRWLKQILIFFLIRRARKPYVAAAGYFDRKQFDAENNRG